MWIEKRKWSLGKRHVFLKEMKINIYLVVGVVYRFEINLLRLWLSNQHRFDLGRFNWNCIYNSLLLFFFLVYIQNKFKFNLKLKNNIPKIILYTNQITTKEYFPHPFINRIIYKLQNHIYLSHKQNILKRVHKKFLDIF